MGGEREREGGREEGKRWMKVMKREIGALVLRLFDRRFYFVKAGSFRLSIYLYPHFFLFFLLSFFFIQHSSNSNTPQTMKVIITGASGVLGRATTRYFHSQGDTVIPLSFTRSGPSNDQSSSSNSLPAYQKLDLLDFDATRDFFHSQNTDDDSHVDVIVHCAAERRPDVAEQDPVRAERLNRDVVEVVARLAEEVGALMVYVSTDYVFDGTR